ncbi:MAG TPA: hypothetical protein VFO77_12675 [Actinoplanes sp.]|nr:hypothetical protein [Actinoplanes sp.]
MRPETSTGRHLAADVVLVTCCGATAAWLVARAVTAVAGDRNAPWILGRASGIAGYLLLVALAGTGLVLSHPWTARWRRPGPIARLRLHAGLAVFTFAFLALHVVVLATDRYAKVGWWGALLPMASEYRPAAVTLGVVGAWCGLLTGLTAALAGRLAGRFWWPLHRLALGCLVLVWLHSVLAGSDTSALRWMYLGSAVALALLAFSRYAATNRGDRLRALAGARPPTGGVTL